MRPFLALASFASLAVLSGACTLRSNDPPPSSSPSPPKTEPALFVIGDVPTTTTGVHTADLFPSMSATADETGVHVWAALIYPAGNFLALGAADALTATLSNGGSAALLPVRTSDGELHYTADFAPTAAAGATSVVVSFARAGGGEPSALRSVVPIAPAFSVGVPRDLAWSQDPMLTVTVTPAPARAKLELDGDCVPTIGSAPATYDVNVDATGRIAFDLATAVAPSTGPCALGVRVRVETQGVWDPAFDTDSTADVFQGARESRVTTTLDAPPGQASDGGVGGG
jgi:hypothetical protein